MQNKHSDNSFRDKYQCILLRSVKKSSHIRSISSFSNISTFPDFSATLFFVLIVPNVIKTVGVAAESKFHVGSSFSYTDS